MKALSLMMATLFTSCASYKGKQTYRVEENLLYAGVDSERQKADLYIPSAAGPHPGVVLVHGGGWKSRSRADMTTIATSLASHGFVVLNINYRFVPHHKHPAPIVDLEVALKYFRSRSQDIKLDPSRVGVWGYSSGGHTVSYYALTHALDPEKKVQAVVAGGAPFDFTWYPHSPYIKGYMGKYRDEMLKEYFDASVTSKVTKDAPPFFIYHAEQDKLVEYAQATALEARLKEQGASVEVHKINFWGHATAFALSDEAVKEAVKFLKDKL